MIFKNLCPITCAGKASQRKAVRKWRQKTQFQGISSLVEAHKRQSWRNKMRLWPVGSVVSVEREQGEARRQAGHLVLAKSSPPRTTFPFQLATLFSVKTTHHRSACSWNTKVGFALFVYHWARSVTWPLICSVDFSPDFHVMEAAWGQLRLLDRGFISYPVKLVVWFWTC